MSLKATIHKEMGAALKAGDKQKRTTLQLLTAAIKQKEIDEQIQLDDNQTLSIIEKMVKQRKESISQFKQAERQDLIAKEEAEMTILQSYLPEPLSPTEIEDLIKEAIANTSATSLKDMGKVMGYIKPKAQGRADLGALSAKIKERLQSL